MINRATSTLNLVALLDSSNRTNVISAATAIAPIFNKAKNKTLYYAHILRVSHTFGLM